ncbi:SixA phosphatase family protein [Cognataquiflexum rubidum]|uniref:SixA phosphatase family protein n=1 Tax=Cognataquiflexum rubidum TaxID=2922273 RepID=UPI001F12BAC1|nr:phosphoglycerate mutase family protein [Cognataquiflexum rubidum]MCH6234631.1 histidine phosphatase family protein [Cognataquiflexum rubidum]
MKSLFTLLIVSLLLLACSPKQEPKTIYIVRHAEKILQGDDPGLSVAGTARSKKLGQILVKKEIQHIFSTNTIRTKTTAKPLADAISITIEIYDAKNHDDLVKELRERTGNILVVGHSNTVNQLANYFVGSGDKYAELQDIEYDFIFEVSLKEDGSSVERKVFKDF